MTVRFLPTQAEGAHDTQPEREEIAEVVELRTKLVIEPEKQEPHPSLPPMEKAVRLLARKPLSMGELDRALRRENYADDQVEEVVRECISRSYLDDVALAERIVEKSELRKKLSRSALKRELSLRLIPAEIIDAVLASNSDESELETMREVAEKRARQLSSLDRATAERRLVSYLARRGFGGSNLYRVVSDALNAQ
jgi:regulatory protein